MIDSSAPRPRIKLTVRRTDGGEAPDLFRYAFDQDEVLVGRAAAVEVRLPHAAVSLVHVRLLRSKGQLLAQDDGSTNGTRLDGAPLVVGEATVLSEGSRLQVGPYELAIGDDGSELTGPHDTAAFARQMVLDMLGADDGGTCYLEVTRGPQRGERLAIPSGSPPLHIGRAETCALHLDDADVSRQHVELQVQGDTVSARDLGSKNGLVVNGERVAGARTLRDGDVLHIGQTRLTLRHPVARYLAQLEADEPPAPVEASAVPVPAAAAAAPSPQIDPHARLERDRFALALVVGAALVLAAALAALVYVLL